MSKVDRNHSDEVYVTSFVPHAVLPNKQPKSLDPFLEKLVDELEELFINGNFFLCLPISNMNSHVGIVKVYI